MVDASVNELLSPISADNPSGEDLSFSPEFDRIDEARREDDPTLDYGEWESTLKQADWKTVVAECEALLKAKTKDMRVAAWLTEGLVKTSGLAGLRHGLEIHVGLLNRFGADIHPRSEEGDSERRIGTISWFIQRAAYLVRCAPLTESEVGKFSLMDYDSAVSLQLHLQRHPESVTNLEERVTLEKFSNAASASDPLALSAKLEIINQCSVWVHKLSGHHDSMLGAGAPSIKPLLESVDAVQQRLHAICSKLTLIPADGETDAAVRQESPSGLNSPMRSGRIGAVVRDALPAIRRSPNGIASRMEAIESLRQVAAYFRTAEPHSPVAYLAEKALHWSEMPLHLWLRSVVKDPGVLSHLEEMLGAEDSGLPSDN